MARFSFSDAIALAEITAKQEFLGLVNTEELKITVEEMFYGANNRIVVDHVQGTTKELRCKIRSDAQTKEEIKSMVQTFERNTYITTKISKDG